MCGVVGFVDFKHGSSHQVLEQMRDALTHRGPDDSGAWIDQTSNCQIGLAHRRLAILDLSPLGHQPMSFGRWHMVYNGEVYNFAQIAQELKGFGYTFESSGDSEVLLKAFDKWGIEAVHKFNGMFAIALFDTHEQKLYLLRDRTGVKPLYYTNQDGVLLFGSELKALTKHPAFKKTLSPQGVSSFFRHGYILQPYSIYQDTQKLSAGHYLQFDLQTQTCTTHAYWSIYDFYAKPKLKLSEQETIKHIKALLQKGFSRRYISDVPVGIFLSGGYDSVAVSALLQEQHSSPLHAFTIGFEEQGFDESVYAKEYAQRLGLAHHVYRATHKDALSLIDVLPEVYDEPFGDSSAIPTLLVAKEAKKQVGVALSADGADEVFGGYGKYQHTLALYNKIHNLKGLKGLLNPIAKLAQFPIWDKVLPFRHFTHRVERFAAYLNVSNFQESFRVGSSYFSDGMLDVLLGQRSDFESGFDDMSSLMQCNTSLEAMMAVDYGTYLADDILTKVDRATMAFSLEGREPFLDHELVEFMAQVPSALKFKDGTTKYLLKQIVHEYIPSSRINRPKKGFGIPLDSWYRQGLNEIYEEALSVSSLKEVGVLNPKVVTHLHRRYKQGHDYLMTPLWLMVVFQMWAQKWL